MNIYIYKHHYWRKQGEQNISSSLFIFTKMIPHKFRGYYLTPTQTMHYYKDIIREIPPPKKYHLFCMNFDLPPQNGSHLPLKLATRHFQKNTTNFFSTRDGSEVPPKRGEEEESCFMATKINSQRTLISLNKPTRILR